MKDTEPERFSTGMRWAIFPSQESRWCYRGLGLG